MSAMMPEALTQLPGADQIGKLDSSELVCRIYDNLYGLPIRSIQEILPLPAIMPLPQLPDSIMGVCMFRDQIIPVLHLASQLALNGALPTQDTWQMVVISHQNRLCALAVCDIIEIINYSSEDIEPLPNITDGEEYFFRGIRRTELGMVTLLNMNAVVEHCHLPPRAQVRTQHNADSQQDNEIISLVRLGTMRFAARIDAIERIVRSPEIIPGEAEPDYIKGKALRPEADAANPQPEDYFPVINMYQLLDQQEHEQEQHNLILPKQVAVPVGFYTGVVEEIREVNKAEMSDIPPLTATKNNNYLQGVLKIDNELILLVDLQQVIHTCSLAHA